MKWGLQACDTVDVVPPGLGNRRESAATANGPSRKQARSPHYPLACRYQKSARFP